MEFYFVAKHRTHSKKKGSSTPVVARTNKTKSHVVNWMNEHDNNVFRILVCVVAAENSFAPSLT